MKFEEHCERDAVLGTECLPVGEEGTGMRDGVLWVRTALREFDTPA
ncbi:hypothetical protein [Rossellomorea sp. LJF3]